MSTSAALPGLTGQDAADLLIGDVARLAVIDWKIAAYQAGEDGAEPPPPPPGWPRPQGPLPELDILTAEPSPDQEKL